MNTKVIIFTILSMCMLGCSLFKPVIIPNDRELVEVPGRPGYYIISAGHLQQLYEQQLILLNELEVCQAKCQ